MICAQELPALADGTKPLAITAAQPADLSTCSYLLVSGSEIAIASGFTVPSPADFGTAWVWGFSLVVGTYMLSYGAGAVLRFFK
ncbi:hypothetical protein [Variovorax sp. RO1]|uniref:hypothetical protein n=1 Tax=Variovorax sp. RO1 TaxID=2066034 RepID=UPI000C716CE8|nr:hypothetical protein [Variovorax sp. RO1]